jgi:4-alpha-glucanotransferase
MAVLQFGFGDEGAHIYLPHTFTADKVVYTGTHDNDTVLGWWLSGMSDDVRRHATAYLGSLNDGIHWAMIRAAFTSVASIAIVPLQDVLGLGSEARMNIPSREDGNWRWRYASDALQPALADRLARLSEVCDRTPTPISTVADQVWAA